MHAQLTSKSTTSGLRPTLGLIIEHPTTCMYHGVAAVVSTGELKSVIISTHLHAFR